MYTNDIKKFIDRDDISLFRALQRIDENGWGILFITDQNDRLIGTISDGDIRKWILSSGKIDVTISRIFRRNPRFVYEDDGMQQSDLEKYMIQEKVTAIPILDKAERVVDIVFRFSEYEKQRTHNAVLKDIPVIIMAGGEGTRLRPYTRILPKPLIPVGDIPIIERIMNRFFEYGAMRFFITVNYKKEMIKSYFAEVDLPYEIKYVDEPIPMGTAGSLRLIKECFDSPVLVSNCDTLIDADYDKILEQHVGSGNAMTIVTSLKNFIIPYGVIETGENGVISSMTEKPEMTYQINTGLYILNPECIRLIPEGHVFHMTDLAEKLVKSGARVGAYPIGEHSFLDMGEFEEMKKMEDRLTDTVRGV